GEAEGRLALAKAVAAENEAAAANVTTNQVMMHAYDALGQLGGTNSTFMFGDYSRLPSWLFPNVPGFQVSPWLAVPPASAKATTHASVKIPLPSAPKPKPNPALDHPYD